MAHPHYAHLPMLVNEQRKKLSKRKDPVSVESYRDQGFLPDAFVNYLALLGWSPRGDDEIVPRATLIEQFRLEDVSHSPAFFDVKKLTHMNGEYIRALVLGGLHRRRDAVGRAVVERVATERPRGAVDAQAVRLRRCSTASRTSCKSASRRWARSRRW